MTLQVKSQKIRSGFWILHLTPNYIQSCFTDNQYLEGGNKMVRITISDLYYLHDKSLLAEPTPREMNTIVGGYRQKNIKYQDVTAELHKKIEKSIDNWLDKLENKIAALQDTLDV
ncbi:MAG: hypothetical protein ACIWVG_24425 [Gloeotrichia echinulata HAB0833]